MPEALDGHSGGIPYKIMIVDDSATIRTFLSKILFEDPEIRLIAQAGNGQIAVDLAPVLQPDVILLDIEMPVLDGMAALPKILAACPYVKVIMVSTLTKRNAAISIKALEAGASDYLEKPTSSTDIELFKNFLIGKIKALGMAKRKEEEGVAAHIQPETKADAPVIKKEKIFAEPKAVAIGCSTGGPQALTTLFKGLGNKINHIPVFITQHMPPSFTTFLAESIAKSSGADCFEAVDGMEVLPGKIYLAPGDFHMLVKDKLGKSVIQLTQDPPENFCRPSVDPMLRSITEIYGANILAVIMTGMGQDGLEGIKAVSAKGGRVLIQDEATSVVWGMPGAVAKNNLQDESLPLEKIASRILEICKKA